MCIPYLIKEVKKMKKIFSSKLLYIILVVLLVESFAYFISYFISVKFLLPQAVFAIAFLVISAFPATYFYYPVFLRNNIFKNKAFYNDLAFFLLFFLLFYVSIIIFLGGVL